MKRTTRIFPVPVLIFSLAGAAVNPTRPALPNIAKPSAPHEVQISPTSESGGFRRLSEPASAGTRKPSAPTDRFERLFSEEDRPFDRESTDGPAYRDFFARLGKGRLPAVASEGGAFRRGLPPGLHVKRSAGESHGRLEQWIPDRYDRDGDDAIDPEERDAVADDAREAVERIAERGEAALERFEEWALEHFDTNGDGVLDQAETPAAIEEFKEKAQRMAERARAMAERLAQAMLNRYDADHDGVLDPEEARAAFAGGAASTSPTPSKACCNCSNAARSFSSRAAPSGSGAPWSASAVARWTRVSAAPGPIRSACSNRAAAPSGSLSRRHTPRRCSTG